MRFEGAGKDDDSEWMSVTATPDGDVEAAAHLKPFELQPDSPDEHLLQLVLGGHIRPDSPVPGPQ